MNLANKLTILRILLTPIFIILLFNPAWVITLSNGKELNTIAIIIFIFAIFTDYLDGLVARKKKMLTPLGTFLDPAADKLLLVTTFITLAIRNVIPLWVMIIVISRDVILFSGWLLSYIYTGNKVISPSILGKLTTFFQMMTIFFCLLQFPDHVNRIFWWGAVIFTVASGINYAAAGIKLLNNEGGKK
ncbi:MAG: CDP-diacylglycerol--glycerol-3-phosphate 3-phosphatidyltransferase [bacterium]|nr:CDP-diacylglycerol--glycerol-3-phosphate 3-phosphatidyltransferase [bacterium]